MTLMETKLVYCETATAGALTPWHIRDLNKGVDSDALCGREIAWDLNTSVNFRSILRLGSSVCHRCADRAMILIPLEEKPGFLQRVKNRLHR